MVGLNPHRTSFATYNGSSDTLGDLALYVATTAKEALFCVCYTPSLCVSARSLKDIAEHALGKSWLRSWFPTRRCMRDGLVRIPRPAALLTS